MNKEGYSFFIGMFTGFAIGVSLMAIIMRLVCAG
jgi:hypothetical protein